jgi:heptosyltransferase III
LKSPNKILIVIQRSNGDVFLSTTLIKNFFEHYDSPQIDLLVNDDTYKVASLLPHINYIHTFSYKKKTNKRWIQEKELIMKLFRRYDLSINLTSSDRSVLYALLASKKSISVVEKEYKKSWWKQKLLSKYYYYDSTKHILIQNLTPLSLLEIQHDFIQSSIEIKNETFERVKNRLNKKGIKNFIIFHPSAQYKYKIYPKHSRDKLISFLSTLGVSIVVTGTNNKIDTEIKRNLLSLPNVFDLIGETSLEEYFALSSLSQAYIGMDTLNMHIATAQNKRIFAIFGPTKLSMWSPWSNQLQASASDDISIQTYGNITIFQADMPCVACGNAGCDNKHGKSDCLYRISPSLVFKEIENWYQKINS